MKVRTFRIFTFHIIKFVIMKKNIFYSILAITIMPLFSQAQLVNEGATITVTSGATLTVNGDVQNNSGTLDLQGTATMKVSKDLLNEAGATLTTASGSTVEMYGADASAIKSSGATIAQLKVNKDASIDVSTLDDMIISNSVSFAADNNKLNIGGDNLTLNDGATISGNSGLRYIQADGVGKVVKELSAAETFEYPVGDGSNYSPVTVASTSGTFGASASIGVNVTDADHPNKHADADAWISRYWTVDITDITDLVATATGTYVDADINGTETDIYGASYEAGDWSYSGTASDDAANTVTADVTQDMDLTGQNFFGRFANLKVFLQGPYSSGTMKTDLNDNGYLPLNTPYGTGESVASIPSANIVDWIKIELRDKNDNTSVLKSYSRFIDKDGQIVSLDGTDSLWLKDAPTEAYVAIRHRNHLGIMNPSTTVLTSYASYDFTTGSGQAWGTDPMKDLGGGTWGMWMGNANGNGNVKYNGSSNDRVKILVRVGIGTPNNTVTGYYDEDINMDAKVKYNGSKNDRVKVLTVVGISTPNATKTEQLP